MNEPDRLRIRAEELRHVARELNTNALFNVRPRTGPHVWHTPRGQYFVVELRRQEEILRVAIRQIEAAAQQLMTQADLIEMHGRAM